MKKMWSWLHPEPIESQWNGIKYRSTKHDSLNWAVQHMQRNRNILWRKQLPHGRKWLEVDPVTVGCQYCNTQSAEASRQKCPLNVHHSILLSITCFTYNLVHPCHNEQFHVLSIRPLPKSSHSKPEPYLTYTLKTLYLLVQLYIPHQMGGTQAL